MVNRVKQSHLFFRLRFAGTFGENTLGLAVFHAITGSASHFANRIGHLYIEQIQKIVLYLFFTS